MYQSPGQIPNQPGIHRAEEQFARLRSNPCAGHVAQNPLDLTAAEIGVRNQAGLFADDFARAFRLESFNLGGGADFAVARNWDISAGFKWMIQTHQYWKNPIIINIGAAYKF